MINYFNKREREELTNRELLAEAKDRPGQTYQAEKGLL